jgi:hypothetical protein
MKKLNLTLLLAVFCTAFSFGQVPSYVPTNGLVGWWPFSGNANDASGNGNNGTVNGATLTLDRFGVSNASYSFNGTNNKIVIQNALLSNTFSSSSISVWFKTSVTADQAIIADRGTNQGYPNYFWYKYYLKIQNNNQLRHGTHNNNCINGVNSIRSFSDGNWHNAIIVLDHINLTIKMYIDGVLENTITNINQSCYGNFSQPTSIGCFSGGGYADAGFFNGNIDDIGIWNRALTQQEVTALYQNCNLNLSANPTQANPTVGANATFSTSGATTYQWQTNPANNGWQNVNNNSTYSGANTPSLNVNNVQLYNHLQQFRVVGISGSCADTAYASIVLADSCVNTVYDTITTSISVTDTLVINAVLSGLNPPNNTNTLQVYPNPARTHITIDNGNFALMNGYTVRINNALGQTVFSQAVNQQQFFIDLSGWTGNGFYYLDLLDPQGNSIERKVIVVQ